MRSQRLKRSNILRSYKGTLRGGRLVVRGTRTRKLGPDGERLSDAWNPAGRLRLELGDRCIVANADVLIDEIATADVVEIGSDGYPIVALNHPVADGSVHVLPIARPHSRKKR